MMFRITKKMEKMDSKEAAYFIALSYIGEGKDVFYIDAATLCCYLFGPENNTASNREKVTRVLSKYKRRLGIKKINNSNVYEINGFALDHKYYSFLEWDDVKKIFRSDMKYKYDLIKYMGLIALSFDKSRVGSSIYDVFGYMAIAYFSKLMKKTVQSISKYNSKLCELGILYVYHRMNNSNVYSFKQGAASAKDFAYKSID